VGVKDERVGFMATEHLIQIGCRHIAHVSGKRVSTALGRLDGYKRALAEHGMAVKPDYIVDVEKLDESADIAGSRAAANLLALDPPPDGIFCFNDPIAIGAMSAILDRGLRIPQDIALIGSGNLHFDHAMRVPLSSIDQASEMIGERAAMQAISLIYKSQDSARPKTVFLTPKLVIRDSTQRTGGSTFASQTSGTLYR
jgi:LacI family transcriptional regulator